MVYRATIIWGPSETEFFLHMEVLSEWLQEKLRLWKPNSKPTHAIGNKCLYHHLLFQRDLFRDTMTFKEEWVKNNNTRELIEKIHVRKTN